MSRYENLDGADKRPTSLPPYSSISDEDTSSASARAAAQLASSPATTTKKTRRTKRDYEPFDVDNKSQHVQQQWQNATTRQERNVNVERSGAASAASAATATAAAAADDETTMLSSASKTFLPHSLKKVSFGFINYLSPRTSAFHPYDSSEAMPIQLATTSASASASAPESASVSPATRKLEGYVNPAATIVDETSASEKNDDESTTDTSSNNDGSTSLSEQQQQQPYPRVSKKSPYRRLSFYRNNMSLILVIVAFVLSQIMLIAIQMHIYSQVNIAVKVARACGILLDFASGLIILLVMRRLITWLRNSIIGRYLPMEHFIHFHKILGFYILFVSLVHTLGHAVNLYWLSNEYKLSLFDRKNFRIRHPLFANLSQSELDELIDFDYNIDTFNASALNVSSLKTLNSLNTNESLWANESMSESRQKFKHGAWFAELLFGTRSGVGWIGALSMPTGWALLAVLAIMTFFSLPFIRKRGYFELFYVTHWLHVVYYILLIIHTRNFWKWFILPFVLVVFERIFTCMRVQSVKYGETYIKDVNLLSSKVTQLIIPRPANFKFKSGDYLYIKVPTIARFEWHPFTISSAPELKGELWLHIRSLGNWTNKLYDYFQDMSTNEKADAGYNPYELERVGSMTKCERKMSNLVVMTKYRKTESSRTSVNKPKKDAKGADQIVKNIERNLNISNNMKNIWMKISIDGPYSSTSRRIFDSEQAILIAGGIGVTPFASILQSLWFKYSKTLKTCNKCSNQWYDLLEQKKLKRVDFIWVNRDYQSFEWFIELLGQLELQQLNSTKQHGERFIGIHLYMTSAHQVQEIKPLDYGEFDKNGHMETSMALDDFSLKLNPGRPDFNKIFADISAKKKGKVDVFFCGSREFGQTVQKTSLSYKFKFNKEYF